VTPVSPTLAHAHAGFVVDLDGVVYRGASAVEHAVDALRPVLPRTQFATNNASRPASEVAEHLTELGLPVGPEMVATSSQAGAGVLRVRIPPGSRVLAVGGEGVALALTEAGYRPVRADAGDEAACAAVLQGYGPGVTAADLARAAYEVEAGALWVATNVDLTLPTDRGVAPGNGSLVAAVANAVGHSPAVVAGKPFADLYTFCSERLGAPPERLLAIGDRLDTDIAGAVAAGMPSLLVLTGVSSLEEAVVADPSQEPTYLAPDLRALHDVLEVPSRGADGVWLCGAAAGRLASGSAWERIRAGTPAQELTVRLHAVRSEWAIPDRSHDAARVVAAALDG
jgi:HAD superfamily hydrolase (TIGR01450 family)